MFTYTLVGIIAVIFVFVQLIKSAGKSLPIIDLTFFIAGTQWIIGPYIDYITLVQHFKYFMYTSEEEYMTIVVPMYIGLIVPYYLFKRKYVFDLQVDHLDSYGFSMMIVGLLATITEQFIPNSLAFLFFLLQNALFVGAAIILFQKESRYKFWAYLAVGWLFYSAISSGFFHGMILWSMFLYFIVAFKSKYKWYQTVIVFFVGFLAVSLIQSIKHDFRSKLSKANNPIELFTELALASYTEGIAEDEQDINELNVRLNQGWIISAIIHHTPRYEPFANGKTIWEAVTSSLLPRFLDPNKKKAGGRENFRKYTGLQIGDRTSMGMSLLGEAYANYGKNGGILFMVIWGLLLTLFWNFLMKESMKNELILFFLPLLFLQAVKAETEMAIVLNHLVKSGIVCFVLISFYNPKKYEHFKKQTEKSLKLVESNT